MSIRHNDKLRVISIFNLLKCFCLGESGSLVSAFSGYSVHGYGPRSLCCAFSDCIVPGYTAQSLCCAVEHQN